MPATGDAGERATGLGPLGPCWPPSTHRLLQGPVALASLGVTVTETMLPRTWLLLDRLLLAPLCTDSAVHRPGVVRRDGIAARHRWPQPLRSAHRRCAQDLDLQHQTVCRSPVACWISVRVAEPIGEAHGRTIAGDHRAGHRVA